MLIFLWYKTTIVIYFVCKSEILTGLSGNSLSLLHTVTAEVIEDPFPWWLAHIFATGRHLEALLGPELGASFSPYLSVSIGLLGLPHSMVAKFQEMVNIYKA